MRTREAQRAERGGGPRAEERGDALVRQRGQVVQPEGDQARRVRAYPVLQEVVAELLVAGQVEVRELRAAHVQYAQKPILGAGAARRREVELLQVPEGGYVREERVVELADFLQAEFCDVGTVPGQCGHALEIESGALVDQKTLESTVRLEEGNPGGHAN